MKFFFSDLTLVVDSAAYANNDIILTNQEVTLPLPGKGEGVVGLSNVILTTDASIIADIDILFTDSSVSLGSVNATSAIAYATLVAAKPLALYRIDFGRQRLLGTTTVSGIFEAQSPVPSIIPLKAVSKLDRKCYMHLIAGGAFDSTGTAANLRLVWAELT